MPSNSYPFILFGSLLLLGLLVDAAAKKIHFPRVSLLILLGLLLGPGGVGILPNLQGQGADIITNLALLMIGFLMGGKMTVSFFKESGKPVLLISIVVVLTAFFLVTIGLISFGFPLEVSLLLASIATATAPAATADVIVEANAKGPLAKLLLGIVAIDDVWCLIIFSLTLVFVQNLTNGGFEWFMLADAAWEIFGALLIGLVLGYPMALFSRYIRNTEISLIEALGVILLCGGIALLFSVSFLLASVMLGMIVANFSQKSVDAPFAAIAQIEWPVMILFFVLSGAMLDYHDLEKIGLIGVTYMLFRVAGKLIGGFLGVKLLKNKKNIVKKSIGLALLPQAGIEVGMALVVAQEFPEYGASILTIVIGSTVLFELIGPILTRRALIKAGEVSLE